MNVVRDLLIQKVDKKGTGDTLNSFGVQKEGGKTHIRH